LGSCSFVHVSLVAQDWAGLARFYEQAFGCTPVPPERALAGDWLEEATGVPGAQIHGMHLRLPGCGGHGPTLEIFQYGQEEARWRTVPNRPGWAHIAFAVDDVQSARDAVLAAGGGAIGETVSTVIPGAGTITFVYVTDLEGNMLELQHWSNSPGTGREHV